MSRATTESLLVVLALLIQACGADVDQEPSGPTVADSRFGGTFDVETFTVAGNRRELDDVVRFDIDTEFGTLQISTSCGTLLGSFSLFDDGTAGVTIAGSSSRSCSATAADNRQDLLDALSRITTWSETGDGFALESPQGDSLDLSAS